MVQQAAQLKGFDNDETDPDYDGEYDEAEDGFYTPSSFGTCPALESGKMAPEDEAKKRNEEENEIGSTDLEIITSGFLFVRKCLRGLCRVQFRCDHA